MERAAVPERDPTAGQSGVRLATAMERVSWRPADPAPLAFSSFGAFWLSLFVFEVFFAGSIPEADVGHAAGLYLWAWAIFTTYMFVASLRTTAAIALVFLLLATTFVLLAIGASGAHDTVTHWGGYVGIATAAAAWYASFAVVVNSTFARTVLPVYPLTRE
jgi:succinate-acetate transporter protein